MTPRLGERGVAVGAALFLLAGCGASHSGNTVSPSAPAPATTTAPHPALADGAVFDVPYRNSNVPQRIYVKAGATFTLDFPGKDEFPAAGSDDSLGPLSLDYQKDGELTLVSSSGSAFTFKTRASTGSGSAFEDVRYGYFDAKQDGMPLYDAFEVDVLIEP